MNKTNIQLSAVFFALASIHNTQAMGPYGPPMMPPGQQAMGPYGPPPGMPPGQMMPPGQAKQHKKLIKPQIKAQFYQQNPRASDKDWDRYWDNYKRQNGLKG